MKSISDLLRQKKSSSPKHFGPEIDEKTVVRIFRDIALSEIQNLSPEDFWDVYFKKNALYVKAVHPAVASELSRKREKIKNKINEVVNSKIVEEIKLK